MTETNRKLLRFIDASPTAWHACANLVPRLQEAGYRELYETQFRQILDMEKNG